MSGSDDKDYKWLVARERGDDISHVLVSERALYEKIGEILGRRIVPPAGFRQRVLARIDAERAQDPQPTPEPAAAAEPAEPLPPAPPAPPAPEIVARPAPEPTPPPPVATPPRTPSDDEPVLVLALGRPSGQEKEAAARPVSRWNRRLGIAAGFAAAAAAVYIVWFRQPTPSPDPAVIALATEVRGGPTVMRGEQAGIGDTFIARAETIGPGELRVYGGSAGKLIARCHDESAGQDGCTVTRTGERRAYRLELTLELPGYTSAVVFAGPDIPPASGSLEQDVNAAAAARIPYQESQRTLVL